MHWTLIIKYIHTGKKLFEQVWLEIIMKTNNETKKKWGEKREG